MPRTSAVRPFVTTFIQEEDPIAGAPPLDGSPQPFATPFGPSPALTVKRRDGWTAGPDNRNGSKIAAGLRALASRPPQGFRKLLENDPFVRWVAREGAPSLRAVARLADKNETDPRVLAAGFEGLEDLAQNLPPSPLRTEAKLLLAVRDAFREGRWLELIALSNGTLSGTIKGALQGEDEAEQVALDMAAIVAQAGKHVAGGLWALVTSGKPKDEVIDKMLRDIAAPVMTPYQQPLSTLADALENPQLKAILDLAIANGLKFNQVLLDDIPNKLNPDVLGRAADRRLSDEDVRHLFLYLTSKTPRVELVPSTKLVQTLFDAYPPFAGADLTGVDKITLTTGAQLSLTFSQSLTTGLTPTGHTLKPPLHPLRVALATTPPALKPMMKDPKFVAWMVANPAALRGLIDLADGKASGFASLTALAEQLPDGTELKNLTALLPALRRIFGDDAAIREIKPLLEKNVAIFKTLYDTLKDPNIVTTLNVTKQVGVPLETVLADVLAGSPTFDPALLTALQSGKLTAAQAKGLFEYLLRKKPNGFSLNAQDASVKAILKMYMPGADISQIKKINVGKNLALSFDLQPAFVAELTPGKGTALTAGGGSGLVYELRRALDTMPTAFAPLASDPKIIDELVKNPQMLADLLVLCDPNPPADKLPAAFAAVKALVPMLPANSKLRGLLGSIDAVRSLFGDARTAAAMQPYFAPDKQMLRAFHGALTNEMLRTTLRVTKAQDLALPIVLNDILQKNGLQPSTLEHVAAGALSADDIQALFAYLKAKKGAFSLPINADAIALLKAYDPSITALPGIAALKLGPGKAAEIDYTEAMDAALAPKNPSTLPAHPGPNATPGALKVYNLRKSLAMLPAAFGPLVADEAFATWIAANPQILSELMDSPAPWDALKRFGEHLPDGSELKPLIAMVPMLRALLGDEVALGAVRPLIANNREALTAMLETLRDPNLKATLSISAEVGLPITTLLKDVVEGTKLPPATLARLVDGNPNAADLSVVLGYLKVAGSGKPIKRAADLQRILSMLPMPKSANPKAIVGMTLGPKDRIHVEMNGRLAQVGPLALDMSALDGKVDLSGGKVVIEADFGAVFKAVFVDFHFAPTSSEGFNTFLDILLKILLAPLLLIAAIVGEIGGMQVRLEDDSKGNPEFKLKVAGITIADAKR